MKNPIDLHIVIPDYNKHYTDKCIESLSGAEINLFKIPQDEKSLGENRKKGFALGSAEFKSYADYDDLYLPNVFPRILSTFEKNPDASLVYTEEIQFNESGVIPSYENPYDKYVQRERPLHVHGVAVYRTPVILSAPAPVWTFALSDWALTLWASTQGKIIKIPYPGRYWRQHSGQISRTVVPKDLNSVKNWFNDLVSSLA